MMNLFDKSRNLNRKVYDEIYVKYFLNVFTMNVYAMHDMRAFIWDWAEAVEKLN
jgi:hypothetical protein